MTRYLVPMFACVDANSVVGAMKKAVEVERRFAASDKTNSKLYLDTLLPTMAIDARTERHQTLEASVRAYMEH